MVTFGSTGLALLAEGVVDAGQLQRHAHDREVVSSGLRRLDPLLPGGGVRRGSLIEWLADGEGSGATTLAGLVACRLTAASSARTIVVVDRRGWFHPPALMPWLARQPAPGHHGPRLIVARPAGDDDEIWAIDQALRCSGVAAVVADARLQALQALVTAQQRAAQVAMVGREVAVLYEKAGRLPGQMVGKSDHLQAVHVADPDGRPGEMVRVRIIAAEANSLAGVRIAG